MQESQSNPEESVVVNTIIPKTKAKAKAKNHTKRFFKQPLLRRSQAKHAVLKSYLEGWFAIFLNNGEDPVYVDGFAGAGKYGKGELGSPILIYKALAEHNNLKKSGGGRIQLIFFEKKKELCEKLRKNLEKAKREYSIKTPQLVINIEVYHGNFNNLMDNVLEDYPNRPMFIFADPFGHNIKMKTLQKILKSHSKRSSRELLINFMNSQLLRFMKHKNMKKRISEDEFLGVSSDLSDDWRKACQGKIKWRKKLNILCEFYGRGLQEAHDDPNKKNYVLKFAMKGPNNAHVYHLIYVTCHKKGLKLMKSNMSRKSQDPTEFQFSEWVAAKGIVRDLKHDRQEIVKDLVERLQEKFKSQDDVPGWKVENFVWEDTPYSLIGVKNELKVALQASGNVSRWNGDSLALDQMTFTFAPGTGLFTKKEGTEEIIQDLLERLQKNFKGEQHVLGSDLDMFIRRATPYELKAKGQLKTVLVGANCVSEENSEKAFDKMIFDFSKNSGNGSIVDEETKPDTTPSEDSFQPPIIASNDPTPTPAKRPRLSDDIE